MAQRFLEAVREYLTQAGYLRHASEDGQDRHLFDP